MRSLIAFLGVSAFVVVAAFAATAASLPSRGVAAAMTVAYATADPSDASRVVPRSASGRVVLDDRIARSLPFVRGLATPVEGAALPTDPELLPNAPRAFRAGWHEGIDFPAPRGTPVHAVAAGTIVRIDHDFQDWAPDAKDIALDDAVQLGYTPSATVDRIRGRQVWIDHGKGIVSRYAHLSAVADLELGMVVERGTVVGLVGSSGYPEGGPHLHLEIRIVTSYLGDGVEGEALTAAITAAFDSR